MPNHARRAQRYPLLAMTVSALAIGQLAACGGDVRLFSPAGAGGGADGGVGGSGGSSSSSSTSGGGDGGVGGQPPPTCEDLAPPDGPPAQCSQNSSNPAGLDVSNNCLTITLEIFWVDYGCVEQSYGIVEPGHVFIVTSFQTHPWRVRDLQSGKLLLDIPPLLGHTSVGIPFP